MKITIEIPENEIKDAVLQEIAKHYFASYSMDRNLTKRITAECVREIIYKDKDAIVAQVVAQASRECRSKAVKKLLEDL